MGTSTLQQVSEMEAFVDLKVASGDLAVRVLVDVHSCLLQQHFQVWHLRFGSGRRFRHGGS